MIRYILIITVFLSVCNSSRSQDCYRFNQEDSTFATSIFLSNDHIRHDFSYRIGDDYVYISAQIIDAKGLFYKGYIRLESGDTLNLMGIDFNDRYANWVTYRLKKSEVTKLIQSKPTLVFTRSGSYRILKSNANRIVEWAKCVSNN